MTLRVTLIAFEIPYPPVHGGRLDVWRRMTAMARMGVDIQLIGWRKTPLAADEEAILRRYARDVHVLPFLEGISGSAVRAVALTLYPLEVTSRLRFGRPWERLKAQVRAFDPDLIIADQLHSGAVALRLQEALRLPLVYRSHNIEHRYWTRMRDSARGFEKLLRSLSVLHLRSYELTMLRRCDAFFDISADDLAAWRALGFTHGSVLPPLIELPELPADSTAGASGETGYDVVFLGNLHSANNVEGVLWFLRQVMPILRDTVPQVRVLVAGSRPVEAIATACAAADNVRLLADPEDAAAVYSSGRVLINPVATGSGVALKSLDMLAAGKPIVTVSPGVIGLPAEALPSFIVADAAEAFAAAIARALADADPRTLDRAWLEQAFGDAQVRTFLKRLEALVAGGASGGAPPARLEAAAP